MLKEAFETYFKRVVADMAAENPKVPVSGFEVEADDRGARLWGPAWFRYMIFGRGPGKFPPPDRMLGWVERNPDILASAKATFKYITAKGLAYLVGRKIAREGTDVWQGKRKGPDILGAMERNMPELLEELVKNELVKIQTSLHNALK